VRAASAASLRRRAPDDAPDAQGTQMMAKRISTNQPHPFAMRAAITPSPLEISRASAPLVKVWARRLRLHLLRHHGRRTHLIRQAHNCISKLNCRTRREDELSRRGSIWNNAKFSLGHGTRTLHLVLCRVLSNYTEFIRGAQAALCHRVLLAHMSALTDSGSSGSRRGCLPVASNTALARAAAVATVPASPAEPQGSSGWAIRCVFTSGSSLNVRMR
jgi:hypothetical protein